MLDIFKKLLPLIANPILSKFHRYRNTHKGETCYLIGDGISIKWFDLSSFKDAIAIPCGFIPFHRQFNELNAPYLLLAEPFYFYPTDITTGKKKKLILNPIQRIYRRDVIDKYPEKEFFINLSNFPTLRNRNNITYIYKDNYDKKLARDYISKRIETNSGSLRVSIAMAIYMGFKDIKLIGYDYTHVPSRSLHWYEKGQGLFVPQHNYQKDFFEIANEFANITSITLDGYCENIESIKYSKYTGNKPIYRENDKIVDEKYLKILSSWPGYNIF